MSGAKFSNIITAIDGILIWTMMPGFTEWRKAKCGEAQYVYKRINKCEMNMQAVWDHFLCFYGSILDGL
eukprot:665106-Ditylum_brightwellii.AAC.1